MGGDSPAYKRIGDKALELVEDAIYAAIALVLVVAAAVLLIDAAVALADTRNAPVDLTVLDVLDRLLLVFIVVELLFAVRVTLSRREIVAEPFLIVGIIASIKEIVVLSVEAADEVGRGDVFRDSVLEIGVLGVLVLLLSIAALLLRRKENEPGEGARTEADEPAEDTSK